MTVTAEAPVVEPEVVELTDDTRKEIVQLRESGLTLKELRDRFPQLSGDQIREVLPPGNARERKAKEAKTKVTESKQGLGGKSGQAPKQEPKAKPEPAPKPDPTPRYVEDRDLTISLSERTLAARQVLGRGKLAEALGMTGSAVWRAEQGRIHADEVPTLRDGLAAVEKRIAAGEFVKVERAPKAARLPYAELVHRIEVAAELLRTARGDKSITKAALVDSSLAVLDPATPT
jgi:hypothetical protein